MDGSGSAVFRELDTIRINKLGANDSGFCVLSHDVGQKPFAFGAPGRNRTCDPASESSTPTICNLVLNDNYCNKPYKSSL